jgi:hypothetical protein
MLLADLDDEVIKVEVPGAGVPEKEIFLQSAAIAAPQRRSRDNSSPHLVVK